MRTQIAALLLVFSALSARAAPDEAIVQEVTRRTHIAADEVRRSYDACDSGVTLSMVICGSYLWVAEDIRLNRIYQQALAKARSMAIESSLVAAQRAWLVYRDKACEYEGQFGAGGGTEEVLYVLSCKTELTKQRADRLNQGLGN